jgi:hypothetical protein
MGWAGCGRRTAKSRSDHHRVGTSIRPGGRIEPRTRRGIESLPTSADTRSSEARRNPPADRAPTPARPSRPAGAMPCHKPKVSGGRSVTRSPAAGWWARRNLDPDGAYAAWGRRALPERAPADHRWDCGAHPQAASDHPVRNAFAVEPVDLSPVLHSEHLLLGSPNRPEHRSEPGLRSGRASGFQPARGVQSSTGVDNESVACGYPASRALPGARAHAG